MTTAREWMRGPQWLSDAARDTWEPVLQRAQRAWEALEVGSVTDGLRGSALVHLTREELPRAAGDCARVGLEVSVLALQPGGTFRAAVHQPGLAATWHQAWAAGDHDTIGQLLGFPTCCRTWFAREWVDRASCDPTPAMATVEGPHVANILLRWLGVRLVPHLPCSGSCSETIRMATAFLEAGNRMGLDVQDIVRLLTLPVTYDSANGVALVETPVFRFMAGADPRADRLVLQRPGAVLVPRGPDSLPPATEGDNGFMSAEAMEGAHAVVEAAVPPLPEGATLLDLGCGDGALLERLRLSRPGTRCYGLEADAGRAGRGRQRHPELILVEQRIEQWTPGEAADLVLLMPGRLHEMQAADAARVVETLRSYARRIVLYAYADWLNDGGLEALALRAGLEVVAPVHHGPGVAAAEGRVR